MILYSLTSTLFNIVISIVLGLFVLSRKPDHVKHLTYFFSAVALGTASIFYLLCLLAETPTTALLYSRLYVGTAFFIPVFYLHHLYTILKLTKTKAFVLRLAYLLGILCLCTSATSYVVAGVSPKMDFNYWPNPGILFHIFLVAWVGLCAYIDWLAVTYANKTKGMLRIQLKYIFFGTLVGYLGVFTNLFLWYDIMVPPFGNILASFYIVITTYAVLRHRFMDFQVAVKNTLVFALIFGAVFSVFAGITYFAQQYISARYESSALFAYGVSIFFALLAYNPLRSMLASMTDKFFFQKKYDYQRLLKDASRGMSKIESLNKLLWLVVHFVTMKMRVRNASILTKVEDRQEFTLGYQRGYAKIYLEYSVKADCELIKYLANEKDPLDIDSVRETADFGGSSKDGGEYDFSQILKTMEELEAVCCVPSFLGRDLRTVLVLGEKKSGDSYTEEDLNVLFTLAQESAIAIENARLFDEALKKSGELEHINEQLEYSKSLLMKALNETEVANKRLQDTQAQLIHEQKMATLGRLAASVGHEVNNPLTILSMNISRALLKYRKNPDLKVGEILDLFSKIEQNIGRIKAVVNTLTGLLKRSEKGKFEPLSLKLVLEETLPLVQFQTYLDNLTGTEVEFIIPSNIPLIRGDLERLQEVFLNLFINAYHAMTGKRNRRIQVTADVDPQNSAMVSVRFKDNGTGMKEETMKKIFNYGFTTKGPGKGSGMGLYMCKYILELHGGDMRVESILGEGTTFVLSLPAYEEKAEESGDIQMGASS